VAETARRELAEETGLTPAGPLVLVDVVDQILRDERGRVRFHYTLVEFSAEAGEGEPTAGGDCAAVAFVPIESLGQFGLRADTLTVIKRASAMRVRDRL